MSDETFEVVRAAFDGMRGNPKPLSAALLFYSGQHGLAPAVDEQRLLSHLVADPNDSVRKAIHTALASWDHVGAPAWGAGTGSNTAERRQRIYALLGLGPALKRALDDRLPHYAGPDSVMVPGDNPPEKWCTPDFLAQHNFYWTRVSDYLGRTRGMGPNALASLERDVLRVVARLASPFAARPKAVRGLVVGYVQSGKTTHFTGVIARAIDAGYRLIIVLSGTIDLLRTQTQRRLDMELVGKENITLQDNPTDGGEEYGSDPDWNDKFIDYGGRPSRLGSVGIRRMTTFVRDFASLAQGISSLEFEKRDKMKPLYTTDNLAHADVRLVVIKKNGARLRKLLRDLETVKESCVEVPALVIDDESDQASVNTVNPDRNKRPDATKDKERNAINEAIVSLLCRLPRAQYLGYTATPFANVFTNPNDPQDIYPRDFILSLRRPDGYMGVREFHDLDVVPEGRMSNERAYVKAIKGGYEGDALREAIDAFVLAGALKKYRMKSGFRYLHHTMLIHESHLQAEHKVERGEVERLWTHAAYDLPSKGLKRLRLLFEEDFRPVWQDRGESRGLPFPNEFDELMEFVGAAIDDINGGDGAVRVVNSDKDANRLDFDRKGVWAIVIGGAKLSRGYTVEGLTVSYFRRRARTQDTLMQMGRWFGFRPGYEDLVRLYIGREEPLGKKVFDLYKAFEHMCRDEEEFREQLEVYAEPGPDGHHITPLQVPALVFNSHPQLTPVAKNKMFNAELLWASFAGRTREPTLRDLSPDPLEHNADVLKVMLAETRFTQGEVSGDEASFGLVWTTVSPGAMLEMLGGLDWPAAGSPLRAELAYLQGPGKDSVDEWLVMFPQLKGGGRGSWSAGGQMLSIVERDCSGGSFNVFSDPRHVKFAKWALAFASIDVRYSSTAEVKPGKGRGAIIVYPTAPRNEPQFDLSRPVIGFTLVMSEVETKARLGFSVRVKSKPDAAVVDLADVPKDLRRRR